MISRRSFSTQSALAAAAASASWTTGLKAAPGVTVDPQFFIYIQVFGAWDTCLAFDPKDRDQIGPDSERLYDQPYSMSEVTDHFGVRLAPTGAVLAPYADRMTIINGIDMLVDNGHIPDAAMSGIQNPRGSNQAFLQASVAGKNAYLRSRSIPHLYLSYDGQFFAGNYSNKSINTSVADFANLFGSQETSPQIDDSILARMLLKYRNSMPDPQSRLVFSNYLKSVDQASQVAQTLKDSGFHAPANPDSPDGIGNFLALLFKSGVLGSATLSFGSRYMFDTHSDHYNLHPLGRALTDVAGILEELKKVPFSDQETIYDRTTLVITAEFARTPRLNSDQGKDHNIRTNTAAIIGRNVRSAVYGASGTRIENGKPINHAALPINFETGAPMETGNILTMKDVWAGSGRIFGADLTADFGTDARPVKFI